MTDPLPDYKNLDLSGEALQAAARMEARAQEPASQQMFEELVAPLLTADVKSICEFGCGTAALSRKMAQAAPHAIVYASDKSEGMLKVARHLVDLEHLNNIRLTRWDLLDDTAYPFPVSQFDLIISSVVIPYFEDTQAISLIQKLSSLLAPGGILAFMEQDWMSDMLNFPRFSLIRAVLGKDLRSFKRTLGLGLRPVLKEAGLQVLPRRSFLWTDDVYGAYTRDLLERFADAACNQSRINASERDEWKKTLNDLAASGDFFYGIVYYLVAGKRV